MQVETVVALTPAARAWLARAKKVDAAHGPHQTALHVHQRGRPVVLGTVILAWAVVDGAAAADEVGGELLHPPVMQQSDVCVRVPAGDRGDTHRGAGHHAPE